MITVTVFNKNNKIVGVQLEGHAEFGKKGKDIVCSAASSIVTTTINGILSFDKEGLSYEVSKDGLVIKNIKTDNITQTLLNNMISLLKELEKDYPTNVEVKYYEVPQMYENRLDLISNMLYGSPSYSWILSYFNRIEDGFTVKSGQKLVYPKSVTSLFSSGELLQSIPATKLNIGEE